MQIVIKEVEELRNILKKNKLYASTMTGKNGWLCSIGCNPEVGKLYVWYYENRSPIKPFISEYRGLTVEWHPVKIKEKL